MMDGGDDVVDHRRSCCIYRERSSSRCDGSCPNARDIHPELVWYNTPCLWGWVECQGSFPLRLYHLSQAYLIPLIHTTELTSSSDPWDQSPSPIPKPNPHLGLLSRHWLDPTQAIVRFGFSMLISGHAHSRCLGVHIPVPSTVGAPQLDLWG